MFNQKSVQHPLVIFSLLLISLITSCTKSGDTGHDSNLQPDTIPETPVTAKAWQVSTVAGTGVAGFQDGTATNAMFNNPFYVAVDTADNLFVTDAYNHLIRKIANGQVTTYAPNNSGNGRRTISGLCVTKNNTLFGISYGNIRKITEGNSDDIFVGAEDGAFKDGFGTDARFNVGIRLTTDKEGNFYATDFDLAGNFCIRKITPDGLVTTVSLNDNTGVSSGSTPPYTYYFSGIAVDRAGNMYYTANKNTVIKKAAPDGTVTVVAGSDWGFVDGVGTDAKFALILALAFDSKGDLYVVDELNNAIRKLTEDGKVTTIAGKKESGFKDGDKDSALFFNPTDIAIDKKDIIYISDARNNSIRKLEYK